MGEADEAAEADEECEEDEEDEEEAEIEEDVGAVSGGWLRTVRSSARAEQVTSLMPLTGPFVNCFRWLRKPIDSGMASAT